MQFFGVLRKCQHFCREKKPLGDNAILYEKETYATFIIVYEPIATNLFKGERLT